jgi:hypothetical protein
MHAAPDGAGIRLPGEAMTEARVYFGGDSLATAGSRLRRKGLPKYERPHGFREWHRVCTTGIS